jgi:hypothetical protein
MKFLSEDREKQLQDPKFISNNMGVQPFESREATGSLFRRTQKFSQT